MEQRWEVVSDDEEPLRAEGARRNHSVQNLRQLAELLDSRFRVLGVRVGWDAILGVIPGFGDIATNLASLYLVVQAANLGVPSSVILRMGLNLIVDNLLDAVPLLGNVFDVFWRANLRNVELLEAYLANPRRTAVRARWAVGVTVTAVVLASLLTIALTAFVALLLLRWVLGAAGSW